MLFPNESISSLSFSHMRSTSLSSFIPSLLSPSIPRFPFDCPLFPFCCLRIIFYSNGTINNDDDVLPIAFDKMILKTVKSWNRLQRNNKKQKRFLKIA